MTKNMILHIDGDAFFAACEIAQNERLRGKPVVAGADRGIALAVSYEAKKLGIHRGMTIKEIRRLYPQVIITSSHYSIYRIYSLRMYAIVRRYAPIVEEYSVDECFADLSDSTNPIEIASHIKRDLERDLGMTFSIGIAPTKVLAKVASKWNKPAGFTMITPRDINQFLETIPVGKIWGIGPSSSAKLIKYNIKTALELSLQEEWWIREYLSKPYLEIWNELRGISVLQVHERAHHKYKSIMKTATFYPATNNRAVLLRELSRNTERACEKLRRNNFIAQEINFYLKSQEFRHYYAEIIVPRATAQPHELLSYIEKKFSEVYNKNRIYRATGVIVRGIRPTHTLQQDIFGESNRHREKSKIYKTIDEINHKQKEHVVFLARSLPIVSFSTSFISKKSKKLNYVLKTPELDIPSWGEAY